MKNLFLCLAVLVCSTAISFTATANEDIEHVDRETLFDVYEFCINAQAEPQPDLALLLTCINEEMDFMGYQRFPTMEAVEKNIGEDPSL